MADNNGLTATFNDASVTIQGGWTVPTSRYSYELTQAEQGNADELHLNLTIKAPQGAALDVMSRLDIKGEFSTNASDVYVRVIDQRISDDPVAILDGEAKIEKEVDTLHFRRGAKGPQPQV